MLLRPGHQQTLEGCMSDVDKMVQEIAVITAEMIKDQLREDQGKDLDPARKIVRNGVLQSLGSAANLSAGLKRCLASAIREAKEGSEVKQVQTPEQVFKFTSPCFGRLP